MYVHLIVQYIKSIMIIIKEIVFHIYKFVTRTFYWYIRKRLIFSYKEKNINYLPVEFLTCVVLSQTSILCL